MGVQIIPEDAILRACVLALLIVGAGLCVVGTFSGVGRNGRLLLFTGMGAVVASVLAFLAILYLLAPSPLLARMSIPLFVVQSGVIAAVPVAAASLVIWFLRKRSSIGRLACAGLLFIGGVPVGFAVERAFDWALMGW